MKNKKGRPSCNDDDTLLAVAQKIEADNNITVRSAIVQCLPVYSDAGIRRVQRKWKTQKAYFLNQVSGKNPRVIDRAHVAPQMHNYSWTTYELEDAINKAISPVSHLQAAIDRTTAPARHLQDLIDRTIAPLRHLQDIADRMIAPYRRIHEMQERISLQMPAIHSAKRLAEALQPSGYESVIEQFRLSFKDINPTSSAFQAMRSAQEK